MNTEQFIQQTGYHMKDILALRRELHKIPELSGQEYKTQAMVCEYFDKIGVEHRKVAETGVYAIIRTGKPGRTIALRGDMDGLPIEEEAELPFKSEHEGMMHACGHDIHMTFLLGAVTVLNELKEQLQGNFVFFFQPSEECYGGAARMIQEGVLENPVVDAVIGSHVWPLPVGTVVAKKGALMACPDLFKVKIKGKGGHGAAPHLCINPIIPLTQIISGFNALAALYPNPLNPLVISICSIHAGSAFNIVPDDGFIKGTVRTYDPEMRRDIIRQMEQVVTGVAQAYGVEGEMTLESGYPATINDEKLAEWSYSRLLEINPHEMIQKEAEPSMIGEDFSYFGQAVPSLFLWFGMQNEERGYTCGLHQPKFNVDEEVIAVGVRSLAYLAACFTRENNQRADS